LDESRDRIIFFVKSDTVNHAIFYLDVATRNLGLVLQASYLDFGDYVEANVVQDYLIWTDGVNEIREINYIRAYNYNNSVSTTYIYDAIDADTILLYKRPYNLPLYPVGNGSTSGKLRGKSFQFAVRLVYFDGQKSVLSQYSGLFWGDIFSSVNGKGDYTEGDAWDSIDLPIYLTYNDLEKCEILVRDNELSNWYLYDSVSGAEGNFIYNFDDSKLRQQVDQNDLIRPYDYIPKLNGHQEIIEKNRLCLGLVTEGFAPTNVDVSAGLNIVDVTDVLEGRVGSEWIQTDGNGDYHYFTYTGYYPQKSTFIFSLSVSCFSKVINDPWHIIGVPLADAATQNMTLTWQYNASPSTTVHDIMMYFHKQLLALFNNTWQAVYHLDLGNFGGYPDAIRINQHVVAIDPSKFNGLGYVLIRSANIYSFAPKRTAYPTVVPLDSYLGEITYYDRNMRYSTANRFATQIDTPKTVYKSALNFKIRIKNKPPLWAHYYSVGFSKRTKRGYYVQLKIKQGDDYFFGEDRLMRIRVQSLINSAHTLNPNCNIANYEYQDGDRIVIRECFYGSEYFILATSETEYYVQGQEYPQDDQSYKKDYSTNKAYLLDANGNKVYDTSSTFIIVPILDTTTFDGYEASWFGWFSIELYRPQKTTDKQFYYHDSICAIGNPGTPQNYHTGNIQNQNPNAPSATPAIFISNFADSYIKLRLCKYVFACYDSNHSDYHESSFYGFGQANFYDEHQKEKTYSERLRWGGKIVEESTINNVNKFFGLDFLDLRSKHGSINRLAESGDILTVLQDRKESSIYEGRTEMMNADGSGNVVANTSVLGTVNSRDEEYGTIFGQSVITINRSTYYFDVYSADVLRSSPNGAIPIGSRYGASKYFTTKSAQILADGIDNVSVLGGYDKTNEMYVLTFAFKLHPEYNETIGFYEPLNKWVGMFSFIPENYARSGQVMLSFENGNALMHNSDAVARCTFNGVKYPQVVNWYSNDRGGVKKIFRALRINSNVAWSIDNVTIEPDATYARGMQSKIDKKLFKLKEGHFEAHYMRNMLTKNGSASMLQLVNGDELRGYFVKNEMSNTSDDEVWLLDIEVNYQDSL